MGPRVSENQATGENREQRVEVTGPGGWGLRATGAVTVIVVLFATFSLSVLAVQWAAFKALSANLAVIQEHVVNHRVKEGH
jgi:hypothetical protein